MLQDQKKVFGDKLYPWLIVLLPALAQYQIGPVDLDSVAMALFFVLAVWRKRYVHFTPINNRALIILVYLVLITVANIAVGTKYSPNSDIILRAGRYCLYLLVVFYLGNDALTYDKLMRAYRFLAYAAITYLLIQAVFYYGAGIILPSRIGSDSRASEYEIGRLRSFFSEPSVLSYSLVPFVVCNLFGANNGTKKASFDAIFVSAGIILSTTGQGILAIGVTWTIWLLLRTIRNGFKAKDMLLLIVFVTLIVVLLNSGILSFALDRASDTGEGGAIDARMSGYVAIRILSPLQLIFGTGFGNYIVDNRFGLDVPYAFVNYSSLAEFIFTLGILGTLLWLALFIYIARKGNTCVRVLLIVMAVLCWAGCPLTGVFMPLWLSLMCVQLPQGLFSRKSDNPA